MSAERATIYSGYYHYYYPLIFLLDYYEGPEVLLIVLSMILLHLTIAFLWVLQAS